MTRTPTRRAVVRGLATILLLSENIFAGQEKRAAEHIQHPPLTNDTVVEGWQEGDLLTSLLHIGFLNELPLGIVIEGSSLCRQKVPGSDGPIRLGSVIEQINEHDPEYTAGIDGELLYIHPRAMKLGTRTTLQIALPTFRIGPETVQGIGISLWMYLRAYLVHEGSAFGGGIQGDAEQLPPFEMTNATVKSILDHTVTTGHGGVWVTYEVPEDWQMNSKTSPFCMVSYTGNQGYSRLIRCPETRDDRR